LFSFRWIVIYAGDLWLFVLMVHALFDRLS